VYELQVSVAKVMGACTADPPMKVGDSFTVRDGDLRIPAGGYVCMWALQSLLPLLPAKERRIAEEKEQDWLWRVHHAQCPDPEGRVIWKVERIGEAGNLAKPPDLDLPLDRIRQPTSDQAPIAWADGDERSHDGGLRALRVVVEEVRGRCTSGMRPGDYFALRSGRLTIPAGRHFCLYALAAVLPMLPAKQRVLAEGDWLKDAQHVICPDPAGNVVLRIEAGLT
jgi:uncharacterized repeat protein (TIGR04076 family)